MTALPDTPHRDTPTFASFIVDPHANATAYAAVRAATHVCAQGQPAGALLLLGAPASGKSHLLGATAAQLAPTLASQLLSYRGADFVALCHAAHYAADARAVERLIQAGQDLGALRRRWARARAVLIDDLCLLAGYPAAQRELSAILAAAHLSGALVLLAGRTAPEARGTWARPTALALAPCLRLYLRPVEAGRASPRRTSLVAAALATHGVTLSDATLAQVAGIPLAPDALAALVRDLWGQPRLGDARRLERLRSAYRQSVRERGRAGQPAPADVLAAVATECRTTLEAVLGRSRTTNVARARQVAMYLLWTEVGLGATAAGRLLGRDHATVLHGRTTMARLISTNPAVADLVAAVRAHLTGARDWAS